MPNPCRKRGRPKESIQNGKTASDVVNLSQSNRPNLCSFPDSICDITSNVLSRFGRVRKAMRVLNDQLRKKQIFLPTFIRSNTTNSMRWNYTWVCISQTTINKNNFIKKTYL
jgi:hypothetical protein